MKKRFIFSIFIFFAGFTLSAQTESLTIGTSAVCAGEEVFLPVMAADLSNIGAITLYISFDTNSLTYLSLENIDPQLTSLTSNFTTSPPQLIIVWSNVTGANFPSTKFFDIKFQFINTTAPVGFDPGCEIADVNSQIIPVSYIDGVVESAVPVITVQPHDTTVATGSSAGFSVISPNATQYLWKESSDNGNTWKNLQDGGIYSGTSTYQLILSQAPAAFNYNRYKCLLIQLECPAESDAATLFLDSLAPVHTFTRANRFLHQNRPNPVDRSTTFEFLLPGDGFTRLTIQDITGNVVVTVIEDHFTQGKHAVQFDAGMLAPGVYFYKLLFRNDHDTFAASGKMIKL